VADKELELAPEEVEAERDYASRAIKREIAGNLWGASARYRVAIDSDRMMAEALKHLSEARDMLSTYYAADQSRN